MLYKWLVRCEGWLFIYYMHMRSRVYNYYQENLTEGRVHVDSELFRFSRIRRKKKENYRQNSRDETVTKLV